MINEKNEKERLKEMYKHFYQDLDHFGDDYIMIDFSKKKSLKKRMVFK